MVRQDTEYLRKLYLPVDELINLKFRPLFPNIAPYTKPHKTNSLKTSSLKSVVTLPFIKKVGRTIATDYIEHLKKDKECGFLYNLSSQKMIIPLNIDFDDWHVLIDPWNTKHIIDEIDAIAKQCRCDSPITNDITRLELLYFYTLLLNPDLTWIVVDYLARGNRFHSYLISHPKRLKPCPCTRA